MRVLLIALLAAISYAQTESATSTAEPEDCPDGTTSAGGGVCECLNDPTNHQYLPKDSSFCASYQTTAFVVSAGECSDCFSEECTTERIQSCGYATIQLMAYTTGVGSDNKGYVCSAIEATITPSKQSYCSIIDPSAARRRLADAPGPLYIDLIVESQDAAYDQMEADNFLHTVTSALPEEAGGATIIGIYKADCVRVTKVNDNPGYYFCDCVSSGDSCFDSGYCVGEPQCPMLHGLSTSPSAHECSGCFSEECTAEKIQSCEYETLQLMADTTGVTSYNKGDVCSAIEDAISPSKQSYCSITGPSIARRFLAGSETTASASATTTTTNIVSLYIDLTVESKDAANDQMEADNFLDTVTSALPEATTIIAVYKADCVRVTRVNDNPGYYFCDCVYSGDSCFDSGYCVEETQCPAVNGQSTSSSASNDDESNDSFAIFLIVVCASMMIVIGMLLYVRDYSMKRMKSRGMKIDDHCCWFCPVNETVTGERKEKKSSRSRTPSHDFRDGPMIEMTTRVGGTHVPDESPYHTDTERPYHVDTETPYHVESFYPHEQADTHHLPKGPPPKDHHYDHHHGDGYHEPRRESEPYRKKPKMYMDSSERSSEEHNDDHEEYDKRSPEIHEEEYDKRSSEIVYEEPRRSRKPREKKRHSRKKKKKKKKHHRHSYPASSALIPYDPSGMYNTDHPHPQLRYFALNIIVSSYPQYYSPHMNASYTQTASYAYQPGYENWYAPQAAYQQRHPSGHHSNFPSYSRG